MMGGLFCSSMLAIGISLFGLCVEPDYEKAEVLEDDSEVWSYSPPPTPLEPEPLTEPEVLKEVVIEYVSIPEEPKPEPDPDPEELVVFPSPPLEEEKRPLLSVALRGRRLNNQWGPSFISFSEPSQGATTSSVNLLSTLSLPASFSGAGTSGAGTKVSIARGYEGYDGVYKAGKRRGGEPVNNQNIITADRYVSGVLETGVNSQVGSKGGGNIVIQTNRHVFSYHGRKILIPKGSRMLCEYQSPEKVGITRMSMNCSRILFGGNRIEIYGLSSNVGDVQGRGGVGGSVDNRFWEKYGSALLVTVLSAGVSAGGKIVDSGDNSPVQKATEELSKRFGEITASMLTETIDIRPVITISQGTRVQIRPSNDWYINIRNVEKPRTE